MTNEQRNIQCRQKILIPRCSSVTAYVSAIDRPEILVRFICAKFSGWPRLKRLTIFFLQRSAYPLYSLYSILRPIWTGECKYPSLSYRFYDFYDRFHYTVEVRSHERGNSGISTGAGLHCEARVNGLKTFRRLLPSALWHINVINWQVTVTGVRNNNVLCNSMKNNISKWRNTVAVLFFTRCICPENSITRMTCNL